MIQLLYMCSQSANKVLRIYEARTKDGNYAIPRTGHSSLPVAKKWEPHILIAHIKIQTLLSMTNNLFIYLFIFNL
jgi:hypothetical protein